MQISIHFSLWTNQTTHKSIPFYHPKVLLIDYVAIEGLQGSWGQSLKGYAVVGNHANVDM